MVHRFIVSWLDLSASLTYITAVLICLLWRADPSEIPNARQIIAAVFVLVWAARLGSFLFLRILRERGDKVRGIVDSS
jgi:steroid 5-alpha reductase family enzyme